ncbi:odorant receptor 46a, isoform B-like [Asbolus verrucosus]|uniref:Odorant receptor 46a, isoform B-like n=1 Tax=Asbolus verrucosus TaxID=1661398 RepID=A0A482W304_ASBVE|nr:odorant receptor 46a, isoform B-like [Asbolus verrucosus]
MVGATLILLYEVTYLYQVISIGFLAMAHLNMDTIISALMVYVGAQSDILCDNSSQIPYSAFESDWTGIPLEAKKNLIIFIIRTQKPIKMSAINLFSLSLATFTTILRTSWSYFAVLRRVNAPE